MKIIQSDLFIRLIVSFLKGFCCWQDIDTIAHIMLRIKEMPLTISVAFLLLHDNLIVRMRWAFFFFQTRVLNKKYLGTCNYISISL